MTNLIYYLPGWAGHLNTGLGKALMDRGFDVTGRETRDDFKDLTFTDQVETVKEDLVNHFWTEDSRVVANSFGAYLFLHAQASLEPYPGKVLLLSPIVGGFLDESTGRAFSPPQENQLLQLAEAGQFPAPKSVEVHTGSEDWQSHPDAVTKFFGLLGVSAVIADGLGHSLGKDYVSPILAEWVVTSSEIQIFIRLCHVGTSIFSAHQIGQQSSRSVRRQLVLSNACES